MPQFTVRLSDGRTWTGEADTQPTEQEILEWEKTQVPSPSSFEGPGLLERSGQFLAKGPQALGDVAIPAALRVGGGLAGAAIGGGTTMGLGTAVGGAIGSGLGESLAEGYEKLRGLREEFNPGQMALQTALGALPGSRALSRPVRMGANAALGATGYGATELMEGRSPSAGGLALSGLTGGALGALPVRPAGLPPPATTGAAADLRIPYVTGARPDTPPPYSMAPPLPEPRRPVYELPERGTPAPPPFEPGLRPPTSVEGWPVELPGISPVRRQGFGPPRWEPSTPGSPPSMPDVTPPPPPPTQDLPGILDARIDKVVREETTFPPRPFSAEPLVEPPAISREVYRPGEAPKPVGKAMADVMERRQLVGQPPPGISERRMGEIAAGQRTGAIGTLAPAAPTGSDFTDVAGRPLFSAPNPNIGAAPQPMGAVLPNRPAPIGDAAIPTTPGGQISLLASEQGGGATFSPTRGVSLTGSNEYVVGGFVPSQTKPTPFAPEEIDAFIQTHQSKLSDPRFSVGVWQDPAGGESVLDVVATFPDENTARRLGQLLNQKAIGRLGAEFEEIPLGGTGVAPTFSHDLLSDVPLETRRQTSGYAEIDPSHYKPTRAEASRGAQKVPRTYWTREGGFVEDKFKGYPVVYTNKDKVRGMDLYDIGVDPLGIVGRNASDFTAAEALMRDAGFQGYWNPSHENPFFRDTVALFRKMPVTERSNTGFGPVPGRTRQGLDAPRLVKKGQPMPAPGSPEKGEISPLALAALRRGTGTAIGALGGAALGDTPEERAKLAVAGGLAGFGLSAGRGAPRTSTPITRPTRSMEMVRAATGKRPGLMNLFRSGIPEQQPVRPERRVKLESIKHLPKTIQGDVEDLLRTHGGFEEQRRGVQPIGRTEALAQRIVTPLEAMRPGTTLNAEETRAHANAFAKLVSEAQDLAKAVKAGTADERAQLLLSQKVDQATTVLANYRGAVAETGRALRMMQAKVLLYEHGNAKLTQQALKFKGLDDETLVKALLEAGDDPLKLLKAIQGRSATFSRQVEAAFYNFVLSGVKTHLRNIIGNTTRAAFGLTSIPFSAIGERLRGAPRTVYMREVLPATMGWLQGARKGLGEVGFTMKHGFSPRRVESLGEASGAFDAPRVEMPGGAWTNWPTRFLEAADNVFRGAAKSQELYASAFSKAKAEGLGGQALWNRVAELITSKGLREQAELYAARAVFQESPDRITARLIQLKQDINVVSNEFIPGSNVGTFIVPFLKTPGNIIRQGLEATPLGLIAAKRMESGRAKSQLIGEAAAGTTALGALALMYATGLIDLKGFGPKERGERERMWEKGELPNAIRVGNTWVNTQLVQPIAVPLVAIANGLDAWKASKNKTDESAAITAANILLGTASSILNQSFVSGVAGLVDAVSQSATEGDVNRWLARSMQGLVPYSGLSRNITQAVDPKIRQPEGIGESVKTIIPGLSSEVRPRIGRFGQEIERPGGPLRRGFIVPEVSGLRQEPVDVELERLGISPQTPARVESITIGRQKFTLTPDQQIAYIQARGMERKARLQALTTRTGFERLGPEQQEKLLRDAISDASETVTNRLKVRLRMQGPITLESLVSRPVR